MKENAVSLFGLVVATALLVGSFLDDRPVAGLVLSGGALFSLLLTERRLRWWR